MQSVSENSIWFLLLGAFLTLIGAVVQDVLKAYTTRIRLMESLFAELKDNSLLVGNFQLAGGNAKARFSSTMWELAKWEMTTLSEMTQEALRKTYLEIGKFNSLVDYDLRFGGPGTGKFDTAMGQSSEELGRLIPAATEGLKKDLEKSYHTRLRRLLYRK